MGTPRRKWLEESDYLSLEARAEQRHEYVAGVVHAMAGAGERHNRVALNIAVQLRLAARGSACGVYVSDMKVRVPAGPAYYYPDVMLSCEPAAPDSLYKEAPCAIFEVLSASTAATDAREKLHAYRSLPSLHYYVLVQSEAVDVGYHVRGPDGSWLVAALEQGERLDLVCGPVRASLTLEEIYEDTGLAVAPRESP